MSCRKVVLCLGSVVVIASHAAEFFVSPTGDDRAPGTFDRPFATLAHARDVVRKHDCGDECRGVTVWLRGGTYALDKTFVLTAADSGRPGAPITYRAWKKETPVLSGAWTIPPDAWKHVEDARIPMSIRDKVWVADVRSRGFDAMRPDSLCGFGCPPSAYSICGLYCNGKLLPLARHPNDGFLKTSSVVDETNQVFTADGLDCSRWTPDVAPDLQAFGYWRELWADMTVPAVVDGNKGAVRLTVKNEWARPKANMPFYLQNALAALDAPGEWFLDRDAGLLYVYPIEGNRPSDDVYELSRLDAPMVVLENVSNVRFGGLVLRGGRRHGLSAVASSRVSFSGCVVRDFGGTGLIFSDCHDCRIEGNVLHTFGHKAIEASGGDRRSLSSSGIIVEANDISDTGHAQHTYMHGITIRGCGVAAVRNRFHELPSSAFSVGGNEHVIASNVVERVVLESDDQGGSDMWGDPTSRGNKFLYNVWRDIGRGGEFVRCGQAAIRFDDAISGNLVYGNRFDNCSHGIFGAVQIHAGRDNRICNNLFMHCKQAVSFYEWPMDRWRQWFARPDVKRMIAAGHVESPAFKRRYPEFATTVNTPMNDVVETNVLIGTCRETSLCSKMAASATVRGNVRFDVLPEDLTTVPGFRPLPKAADLGPGDNSCLKRAMRNDWHVGKRKRLLAIGDSITAAQQWQVRTGEVLGMDVRSHCRPGIGAVAMVDGDGHLPPLSANDVRDVDLVLLVGFYNERVPAVDSAARGCVEDRYPQENTVYGRLNYVIRRVHEELEKAGNRACRLMIVSPHCYGKYPWIDCTAYEDGDTMVEILRTVASRHALPFADMMTAAGIDRSNWFQYQASASAANKNYLPADGSAPSGKNVPFDVLSVAPSAKANAGKFLTVRGTAGCFRSDGVNWVADPTPYIWNGDQLHLNAKGYRKFGEAVAHAVLGSFQ